MEATESRITSWGGMMRLTWRALGFLMRFRRMLAASSPRRFLWMFTLVMAGVEVLLHTQVIDTNVENGRLESVTLFGKSRCIEVEARVFIDATGDGDVAYLAGASYEKGQNDCGTVQPPTVMCTLGGVDVERTIAYLEAHPEQSELPESMKIYPGYDASYFKANPRYHVMVGMRKLFLELKADGVLPVDRDTLIYIQSLISGQVHINCTRHLGTSIPSCMTVMWRSRPSKLSGVCRKPPKCATV